MAGYAKAKLAKAMTKNKEPDAFIKQLKGVFKKIITMPIENEPNSVSSSKLYKIATKNNPPPCLQGTSGVSIMP